MHYNFPAQNYYPPKLAYIFLYTHSVVSHGLLTILNHLKLFLFFPNLMLCPYRYQ